MLTDKNIEVLKQRVKTFMPDDISEETTREELIDLTLHHLGWAVSDGKRVDTKYRIQGFQNDSEGWVDYALTAENRNPAVFVKAEKLAGMKEANVEQFRRYAFGEVARKGTRNLVSLVLTDGNVWKFYPLSHGKGIDYYPHWCHTLDLETGEVYKIKEDLNKLLDIQKVSSGESSKYLEWLFRLNRTKKACESILARPPETLLELIEKEMAEDDCESDREEIKRTLSGYLGSQGIKSVEVEDSGVKQTHSESPQGGTKSPTYTVPTPVGVRRSKLRVEYGRNIFGGDAGQPAIDVVTDVLNCFIGKFGIVAVHGACVGWRGKPLVVTDAEAEELIRNDPDDRSRPLIPGYRHRSKLSIRQMGSDLKKLTKGLGIYNQVIIVGDERIFPKLRLRVEFDEEIFEQDVGQPATAIVTDVLNRIIDEFGIYKVAKVCANLSGKPLVLTDEEAKRLLTKDPGDRSRALKVDGYRHRTKLSNAAKASEIRKLTTGLGISHRVKVELVD